MTGLLCGGGGGRGWRWIAIAKPHPKKTIYIAIPCDKFSDGDRSRGLGGGGGITTVVVKDTEFYKVGVAQVPPLSRGRFDEDDFSERFFDGE